MTPQPGRDPLEALYRNLTAAARIAVIGVGDERSPSDRVGMLAAQEIDVLHLLGLAVFFAETVPESMTGPVRNYRPDHILIFDAADMGLPPGTLAAIPPGSLRTGACTAHPPSLSLLIDYLQRETGAAVTLIGIQPETAAPQGRAGDRARGALFRFIDGLSRTRRPCREAAGHNKGINTIRTEAEQ